MILAIVVVACMLLIVHMFIWWYSANENYSDRYLQPNDVYYIGNKVYRLPNLKLSGNARLLRTEYLERQKALLQSVFSTMNSCYISCWVSGGTLLGMVRHKTFIPWDDDCDIHTSWSNRNVLYSNYFKRKLQKNNLERILLIGTNQNRAGKCGAAVRIRFKNSFTPVCDVFFVKHVSRNMVGKIDSWVNESIIFNKKEQWPTSDLFPLENHTIDDMSLTLPNKPTDVIVQQYGDTALTDMYARNTWFSHNYPFKVLHFIWGK